MSSWHGELPLGPDAVSLSELERLVGEAEADASLRQALRRCRSRQQLIQAARRLGYRITGMDLQRAWQLEQQEKQERSRTCAAGVRGADPRR